MAYTTRPLHDHQQRALAAAAGLVGRPRLRAGLALTLAFACSPLPDSENPGAESDTALTDAASTLAPSTGTPTSTGSDETSSTSTGDSTGLVTTGGTLLTDASTTLATTTDASTGDATGTGTTTDATTGTTGDATTGTTGELDDCVLDRRTMEMDWACCEAQDWQPAPQCTPWGPPAPPAADHLLQARAARRVLA